MNDLTRHRCFVLVVGLIALLGAPTPAHGRASSLSMTRIGALVIVGVLIVRKR